MHGQDAGARRHQKLDATAIGERSSWRRENNFAIFLSVPIGNEAISTMADSAMVDDLFGYIDVFARERPLGANRFLIDFEFSR